MSQTDFRAPRLYVDARLAADAAIELTPRQAHYLTDVLRLADADAILAFNGRDGEWKARLSAAGKKRWRLAAEIQTRQQPPPFDLHYLFAPLKHARLDYMVQKAVEMGVSRLRPVLTRYGQVARVNLERMTANAIEAAEQCGILSIPAVDPPARLDELVENWEGREDDRRLVFCDEAVAGADPLALLSAMPAKPLAVLIGPEGGFADDERALLRAAPFVTTIPLGPRILRADTAAVAALALVQAAAGDWRHLPAAAGLSGMLPSPL
jgi:16S rRNA (uracil1498-N3)-methyltransferase